MHRGVCFLALLTSAVMLISYLYFWPVVDDKSSFREVPDIELSAYYGEQSLKLSSINAQFQLLHFWAPWCAPCREELPQLIDFSSKHRNKVKLVLITVDTNPAELDEFIQHFISPEQQTLLRNNSVWLHLDANGEIGREVFQVYQYPETIVISPKGKMLQKYAGPVDIEILNEWRNL